MGNVIDKAQCNNCCFRNKLFEDDNHGEKNKEKINTVNLDKSYGSNKIPGSGHHRSFTAGSGNHLLPPRRAKRSLNQSPR